MTNLHHTAVPRRNVPPPHRLWIKTIGGQRKTRYRGTPRVGWMFTLSAAAYDLIRLPKLLGAEA